MLQTIIDNWDKIASLLLSLVAICIALTSSWQTSKQATQQINELRNLAKSNAEDADRQIESIKKMTQEATDGVKKQMIGVRELVINTIETSIGDLDESIHNICYEIEEAKKQYQEEVDKIMAEREHVDDDDELISHSFVPMGEPKSALDIQIEKMNRKYQRLLRIRDELKRLKQSLWEDYKEAIDEAKRHGTYYTLYKEDLNRI